MAYTFAQLEGLWIQAGGNRSIAPVMAAIALAESSGNPGAENPNDNGGRQTSYGLWQISNGTHSPPSANWANPLENAKLAVAKLHDQGLSAWGTYTSGAYKHYLGSAAPQNAPTGTGQGSGTTAGSRGSGGTSGTPGSPNTGSTSSGSGSDSGGLSGWVRDVANFLDIGVASSLANNNPLDSLSAIAQAIQGLTLPFIKIGDALDWFFSPSHWIRLFAGIAGGGLTIGGVYELAHTEDDHPAALPIGIGMTGVGLVLLFVAFHNLDPSVKTVGEFIADLQGKVQTDLQATTSPAAAVQAAGG